MKALFEAIELEGLPATGSVPAVDTLSLTAGEAGASAVVTASGATIPALPDDLSIDSIVEIFKMAKEPAQILGYAKDCSVPVWLDWLVKLSPKQVKLGGQVDIRAVFANLGPQRRGAV